MRPHDLLKLFEHALPSDLFSVEQNDLSFYGKDSCKDFDANPSLIFLPRTKEDVSTFLKICNEQKISVVPSGGRTGYSGGATATKGEAILSLERLNKILDISVDAQTIRCQAGVKTQTIIEEAARNGLFYGVDFASKGSSHIGGNISTNAGGIRVIRYGNTREWVLGMTVVLADGTIQEFNGELIKNQTGYDFRHLFIGSEGTLGVVVEATIKLTAKPRTSCVSLCGFSDVSKIVTLLGELKKARYTVNVIEYFDSLSHGLVTSLMNLRSPFSEKFNAYALIEVEVAHEKDNSGFEQLLVTFVESGLISDVVVSQSESQTKELMSLREKIPECTGKHFVPHKNDISVPVRFIAPFIQKFKAAISEAAPSMDVIIFGHIGDGNLHIHLLKPDGLTNEDFFTRCKRYDQKTFEVVQEFKGSISAEHGVGLLKRDFLTFSRTNTEIALMKGIKRVFDPNGILNPGKIFD